MELQTHTDTAYRRLKHVEIKQMEQQKQKKIQKQQIIIPIKKKSNLLFFHKIQIIIYILMRRDFMNESKKKRVLLEAKTIIETQKTLRDMEQLVQVSKSTIHKDMQQRLIELEED